MAVTIIKSYDSDNQAQVTAAHELKVTGTFTPSGTSDANIVSISGAPITEGQKDMAHSLPVVIASDQSAIPVSGTFFQATQPVSGTVAVSNFPATQAVSGTFFQATQPVSIAGTVAVSGPLTDTQLRATPVPVSGTVAVSNPGLTDTQLRATPVPVSGTVAATQSGTWNVTNISGTVSLPTGAATSAIQTSQLTQQTTTATNTTSILANQTNGTQTTSVIKTPLTPSAPTFVTAGVASGVALAANALRKGAIFVNTSPTATVSFGLAAAGVLNSGITLTPYGVWVMDPYTFTTGAINVIASAAATNVAIQELTT